MNISKFILILILAVIGTGSISADNRQSRKYIRHGNSLYRSGKHREALVDYYKAMRADSTNARALYNLGTSMFPEQWKVVGEHQRDTMINYFKSAAQHETTPYRKSQAFHNIGVICQGAHDFQNAVEAYKMALRFNPNDDETRYNLVLCQRQLKKQGGGNNNQQNKQDQQKQQDKQQQQKQDKQQEQQEPPMSKENAEQLLNAAMQQEKQTQQRMQDAKQQQSKRRRIEKNW